MNLFIYFVLIFLFTFLILGMVLFFDFYKKYKVLQRRSNIFISESEAELLENYLNVIRGDKND